MTNQSRFEIGDEHTGYDTQKLEWIKLTFSSTDYKISGDGFMFSTYYIEFIKPQHSTWYRLRWE